MTLRGFAKVYKGRGPVSVAENSPVHAPNSGDNEGKKGKQASGGQGRNVTKCRWILTKYLVPQHLLRRQFSRELGMAYLRGILLPARNVSAEGPVAMLPLRKNVVGSCGKKATETTPADLQGVRNLPGCKNLTPNCPSNTIEVWLITSANPRILRVNSVFARSDRETNQTEPHGGIAFALGSGSTNRAPRRIPSGCCEIRRRYLGSTPVPEDLSERQRVGRL